MKIPSEVVIKARSLRMGNGVSVPAILFVCGACGRVLKPGEGSRTCPDCGSRDIRDSGRPFAQRCRPACLLRIGRSAGLVGNTARIFGYFFNWYICSCILSP